MGERVYINDLTPITSVENDSMLLIDQNGYKKMYYSDFIIDIANNLRDTQDNDWNAQLLDGVRIGIENPLNRDSLFYNSSTQRFENRKTTAADIDWMTIDVNEYKFMQVSNNGLVETAHVKLPSLRMDNDYSEGYFLRVKADETEHKIEAVPFNPDEFTINAQFLEGNNISDLDDRYMRGLNNLSEVADKESSRNNLEIISEIESDNRYVAKSQNLNDIANKPVAFNNIKQLATTSYQGVIEIATSPEVQDGVRDDVAVVPSTLSDNYYRKSTSDGRYLQRSNNLTDINNLNAARANLDVFSRTESDSRYLQKGLNLSELTSKEVSRNNLEVYSRDYIDQFTLNPLNNLSDVDNTGLARNNIDVYSRSEVYTKTESDDKFFHSKPLGTLNLNSVTRPGSYYQTANANSTTARNYPISLAGSLLVQDAAGVTQQYTTYGSTRRMFIRGFYSNSWSAWREVLTATSSTVTNWTYLSSPYQIYDSTSNTSGWDSTTIPYWSSGEAGELYMSWNYTWSGGGTNKGASWATIRGSGSNLTSTASISRNTHAMMISQYIDGGSNTFATSGSITLPVQGNRVYYYKTGDTRHHLRIYVHAWRRV